MKVVLEVAAIYHGNADEIFAAACRFSEMAEAMSGFATYEGIPEDAVAVAGQVFVVDVTFWRFLKIKGHEMSVVSVDRDNRVLQSREHGPGIRHWDHTLSVQPQGQRVEWLDRVLIDAGWKTPFVWRFAASMYKRRHRYRRAESIRVRTV